jgi:ferric-dicitrate binding protein FerR (iron transport regulator)
MKEDLIKKWLKDELSPEELEAFKKLDDYSSYVKLSDYSKLFKAPEFDQDQNLEGLKSKLPSSQINSRAPYLKYIAAIAAVFLIAFTLFKTMGSSTGLESFETLTTKTENISLPDQSLVSLNANSQMSFDSEDWSNNRELELEGEAYFKVEKGSKFSVNTTYGNVEVLGTVFNVKSREYVFEVVCYEGSVGVNLGDSTHILKPNDRLIIDDSKVLLDKVNLSIPDWKNGISIIESKPLEFVLNDLKNYYDIKFEASNIDTTKIYTGSFTHDNLEIALNSITLPLGLSYKINGETVLLSNK